MSATTKGPVTAAQAEREADRLRLELAGTLEQLADNLAPRRLASEAAAAASARTPDWLKRYWAFAQSPAGLAIIGGAFAIGIAGTAGARSGLRRGRKGRWR